MSQSTRPLSPEVAALLAAIRDALDVPLPGVGDADERQHRSLLERRAHAVFTAMSALVREGTGDGLAFETQYIRSRTAGLPVTYAVWPSEGPAVEQRHQFADDAVPSEGGAHPLAPLAVTR